MADRATDREQFRAAVERAQEPLRYPPSILDEAGHDRVAREAIAANPELVERARRIGDYVPLIRAAECAAGRGNVSPFWLASLLGPIVRGKHGDQNLRARRGRRGRLDRPRRRR